MEKRKSRKDSSIFVRMSSEERSWFKELAESRGLTLSKLLKQLMLEALKKEE